MGTKKKRTNKFAMVEIEKRDAGQNIDADCRFSQIEPGWDILRSNCGSDTSKKWPRY